MPTRRLRLVLLLGLLAAGLLAAGCRLRREPVDDAFERMERQPRADAYEATDAFADARVLQPPPAGTVPWSREAVGADTQPPRATRALLERGRSRFDIFCAACHGQRGDGRSFVAANLGPGVVPSLHDPARRHPPPALYRIITEGRGRMPSYAAELPPPDRWAVIAYMDALRLSEGVPLDSLPRAIRAEAEAALGEAR